MIEIRAGKYSGENRKEDCEKVGTLCSSRDDGGDMVRKK